MELEGLVFRSTGSWYVVEDNEGNIWNTRLKGKLKIDDEISSTNPIAVGDRVVYEVEDSDTRTGTIKSIKQRRNYIIRVSPHNRNQKHIIASNLDLAVVVATIAGPRTSTGFIDRFLITAEAYHIPALIVVNKADTLKGKHLDTLAEWRNTYGKAGYDILAVSALDKSSLGELTNRLEGITTLFSGHSGVGKSTLINQLIPGVTQKTVEISGWSGKGQHTTTFAEMFHIANTPGLIIDTPGVKEFGIIDFSKQELAQYFPEMRSLMPGCRFNNCMHLNEPGCAVLAGLGSDDVPETRYQSYLAILDSFEVKW
ncbi:MAG: ribosome small subunit-dependent GTPase A [Chitinophagia bacterium]|nr:ribosome small subunit-dependent GTPase A [Chitinophagia bacterium]